MNNLPQEWIEVAKPYLVQHARPDLVPGMSAYMKNQFAFFGMQRPVRVACFKALKSDLGYPNWQEAQLLLPALMALPEREWHYLAIEIGVQQKFFKQPDALPIFEACFAQHTWWDSVDPMAVHWFGNLLLQFPNTIPITVLRWAAHPNFWYQRLSLLYCLKYKEQTPFDLLEATIAQLAGTKEFFVQKAIGWVLREKSKTHPDWVRALLQLVQLPPLAVREGSKYL